MLILSMLALDEKSKYVMRCAIWYHLYNLTKVKNTHGGVLILVTSRNFNILGTSIHKSQFRATLYQLNLSGPLERCKDVTYKV